MTSPSTNPTVDTADILSDSGESLTTISVLPTDTFELGEKIGYSLKGGEVVLLYGGLGAGKTLFTKGILNSFGYDIDEVTSPSFTLVNLYKAPKFDVYHIDLWRLDGMPNAAGAVGLDEILESPNAVIIIEWADHLGRFTFSRPIVRVDLTGDGDEQRSVTISRTEEAL